MLVVVVLVVGGGGRGGGRLVRGRGRGADCGRGREQSKKAARREVGEEGGGRGPIWP